MPFSNAALWLGLFVIMLLVEAAIPGLVSIWFAVGALAAFISSLFGSAFWLQTIWFFAVSIILLILTRPLAKKYVNSKAKPTNADMIIGQVGTATETIDNIKATGTVSVLGKTWTARSDDGTVIQEGQLVTILRIEGVKAIVITKQ